MNVFIYRGGVFMFDLINWYSASWSLLVLSITEILLFMYAYGYKRWKNLFFSIRQHLCKRHLHLLTSLVLPLQIIVRITRPVFKSIWLIIHVYMYVILWNTKVTAQSSAFQGVWEHRGDGYAAAGGDEVLLDGLLVLHHPPRPHLCPHHDFRPGKRAFKIFDFFI